MSSAAGTPTGGLAGSIAGAAVILNHPAIVEPRRGMRIHAMQPREPAPTIRRLPLPGADDDAYKALHDHGAHLLLCGADKRPIAKAWEQHPANLDAVIAHHHGGGLIGVIPASVNAVVVDVDDAEAPAPPLGTCVLQNATRREGGRHFWYPAPSGGANNHKWKHGDVRCSNGYVILWDVNSVVACVIGNYFTMSDAPDLSKLPDPIKAKAPNGRRLKGAEAIAATPPGARNETCFREVCFAIERGEDLEPLRKAAIAVGLSEREVDATIKSAESRTERSKLTLVKAAAGAVMSEADLGASYAQLYKGDRLHRSDGDWLRWQDAQGWTLDPATAATLAEVMRLGRDTFCRIGKEGPKPDPTTGGRASTSRGALTYARAQCWSDASGWDTDPWLIGVPGGQVIDLHNGTIRSRTRADLIERTVAAVPAQEWRETRWDTYSK